MNDLEKRFNEFEAEVNHNLTMLLGQSWKQGEQLRLLKSQQTERFDRLDDRVTEAHKELAEIRLELKDTNKKLDQALDLLNKIARLSP